MKINGAEIWGYSKITGTSLEELMGHQGEDWLSEGASRRMAMKNSAAGGKEDDDRPTNLVVRKGAI